MSTKIKNQEGIVHVKLLLIAMIVIGAIVFTGLRVQSARNNSEDNKATTNQTNTLANDKNKANTIDTVSEKTEESASSSPVQATPIEEKTLTNKTVVFTKGGGSADTNNVTISSTANEKLNGTCTYILKLGNSQVTESVAVSNTTTCNLTIPVSKFPKNGEWQYTMTYKSKDGTTTGGTTNPGVIYLYAQEPRAISFSKGGATSDVLEGQPFTASFKLSEAPQTGTCEHWFYGFNTGSQLTKTTQITNSDKCEITIPVSDFPAQDSYQYQVSFTSNDGKVVAYMVYFDNTNMLKVTK